MHMDRVIDSIKYTSSSFIEQFPSKIVSVQFSYLFILTPNQLSYAAH